MNNKKHGVWAHATEEELAIQNEIGEITISIIELTKKATAFQKQLTDQLNELEKRATLLKTHVSVSGFELAEKVRERHNNCENKEESNNE